MVTPPRSVLARFEGRDRPRDLRFGLVRIGRGRDKILAGEGHFDHLRTGW
jgi:hypothetical protein